MMQLPALGGRAGTGHPGICAPASRGMEGSSRSPQNGLHSSTEGLQREGPSPQPLSVLDWTLIYSFKDCVGVLLMTGPLSAELV